MKERANATDPARSTHNDSKAATVAHAAREVVLAIVRTTLWVGFTTVGVAINVWGAVTLLLLLAPASLWGYLAVMVGVAIAGGMGGLVIGLGQVLALRRWLDGVASISSLLSTVLASSAALAAGTSAGWWAHTAAGDLTGGFVGLVVYGSLFGLLQRPMVDYMAGHSLLWVPVNAAASVLGAVAMLAAFDVSGGRRDSLQFRYVGIVYAVVTGVALLWMTRQTRREMAAQRRAALASMRHGAPRRPAVAPPVRHSEFDRESAQGYDLGQDTTNVDYDPNVLEMKLHFEQGDTHIYLGSGGQLQRGLDNRNNWNHTRHNTNSLVGGGIFRTGRSR